MGGDRPDEGQLEHNIEGTWSIICGYHFDNNAATVVCRELGFPSWVFYILCIMFFSLTRVQVPWCSDDKPHQPQRYKEKEKTNNVKKKRYIRNSKEATWFYCPVIPCRMTSRTERNKGEKKIRRTARQKDGRTDKSRINKTLINKRASKNSPTKQPT